MKFNVTIEKLNEDGGKGKGEVTYEIDVAHHPSSSPSAAAAAQGIETFVAHGLAEPPIWDGGLRIEVVAQ